MAKSPIYCQLRRNKVVLGNTNLQVILDRSFGRLDELTIKRRRFGQWNLIPGWTEVVDELEEKTFRDGKSRARVRVDLVKSDKGCAVCVQKSFSGAAFIVTETWTPTKTEIQWSVGVKLKPGKRRRSIQIRQFVPWPDKPGGWNVWTAQQHFPKSVAHMGNQRIVYGDVCFGTVVPIATIYDAGKDVGLSLAKPFGLKIPQWGFRFDTYHFGGINVESMLLGLRPKRDAFVSLMLRGHEGCWRPGLGWLVNKYPEYFRPGNPATPEEIEGGFMIGDPFTTAKECRTSVGHGGKAMEVHFHFKHSGNYFPDDPTWKAMHEKQKGVPRKMPTNSIAIMNKNLKMFRKMGLVALVYIQVAGDASRAWAEKNFPESIVVTRDRRKFRLWDDFWYWEDCYMLNSDPSLLFGKHMSEQIDRFFERHGDVAGGLFWDQPCYDMIDMAHDDGITMVDNKPAYRLVFCYEKHAEKMLEGLRQRGKFFYANGPVYIELCRGVDAIMAEGHSWTSDVDQYMCAARPMLFYTWPPDPTKYEMPRMEEVFQKCLLLGGTCYSAHPMKINRQEEWACAAYRPMIDRMRGRTFCFDPNPLTVPDDVDGNVFRGGDGNVYVPLITRRVLAFNAGGPKRNLSVELRLPDAAKFSKATSQGTMYTDDRPVRLTRQGRRLTLTVREHLAATLVCLHRAK